MVTVRTPNQVLWVLNSLSQLTALCSLARHFTLVVSLFTQVYEWVPDNLILGYP